MTGARVRDELLWLERWPQRIVRASVVLGAILALAQLYGCGSTLQTTVDALHVSRAVLDVSHDAIISGARVAGEPLSTEQRREMVASGSEPWGVAIDSHNAAVSAWELALAAVPLAESTGDWTAVTAALLRLVSLYDDVRLALSGTSVDLPEIPSIVLRLAGR